MAPTRSTPAGWPMACWPRRNLTPRRPRALARARSRLAPRPSWIRHSSDPTGRADRKIMDPQTCRAQLKRLIQEETAALGELAVLLDREFTHMQANDVEAL